MSEGIDLTENLWWHSPSITRNDRMRLNKHESKVLWFTGLSGAGKSTLATMLEKELFIRGIRSYLLDGDNVRHGLNNDLGFSPEGRKENIRRLAEVSKLFLDAGLLVLTSSISPYEGDRLAVRNKFDIGDFIEIYIKCDLQICEKRDPKGLYRKARCGDIDFFTGISAPYEVPTSPEIIVETDRYSIEESVNVILSYLEKRGYLNESKR